MKRVVIILGLLLFVTACSSTGNVVSDYCTDSDGNDPFKFGKVEFSSVGINYEYKDTCVTTRRIKEGVCNLGALDFEYHACPGNGRCKNGKCRY